ncbi:MAG: helix-turn-helix domain-containing protein [Clostridiales bacterium]|nr:helix-turn-helix domain-containing protein [Clostridiales bacterium]
MTYNSDALKKYYHSNYLKQRTKNLVYLREEIAHLTQAQFIKEVGFTKSDISNLESGDKDLSLFHMQAYRCYFESKYGIEVSVDYLMGYTGIITNDNAKTERVYGLSEQAVENLKNYNKEWKRLLNHLMTAPAPPDTYCDTLLKFLIQTISKYGMIDDMIYYEKHETETPNIYRKLSGVDNNSVKDYLASESFKKVLQEVRKNPPKDDSEPELLTAHCNKEETEDES